VKPSERLSPPVRWGIVVVLLAAAVLRLAALPELPLGLHYDEAANLILTRQIVEEGYRPLFIRAYTGKEVLFFYAAAPWVWMTGGAAWGLRLGAAMLGILTVAASFAAVRALLVRRPDGDRIALFAAGWMALAFPHVLLSRYGFRAISQPLLQALAVATLWRGLRTGKGKWLIPAGALLGLTAYTYLAARIFPIPLALSLAFLLMRTPAADRGRLLGRYALALVAALIFLAPLGVFFLQNPETFMTRITQVAAPSLQAAARGIGRCLRAIVWTGGGDGYIRFNAPGVPLMRPAAALLALVGASAMLFVRRRHPLEHAGRGFVLLSVLVMVLPSALATGEITPSNLRMVGLYPFIALLPAWGLCVVLARAPAGWLRRLVLLGALLGGCALTATQYVAWAGSAALFRAADGEMVLAAEALDAAASDAAASDAAASNAGVTVYVTSEHYRHPTVAALATHYAEAKWLTGGATLVLPAAGDAVVVVPERMVPPAPWPDAVTRNWTTRRYEGPSGDVALNVHTLSAGAIERLRQSFVAAGDDAADFAHVVLVHDASPAGPCEVAAPCPFLVVWEPRAAYPALQPVVRLVHPETGEWARTMAFHYPTDQWSPGELVLDQLTVTPPVGTPPGARYRLSVGFFDPDGAAALPRLVDEAFAGLEVRFPEIPAGVVIAPMTEVPDPAQVEAACTGVPRNGDVQLGGLRLLGWQVTAGAPVLPGGKVSVRLCWQATEDAPAFEQLRLVLSNGPVSDLYAGSPAGGYGFADWRAGEIIEDRYTLYLPRTLSAGAYVLALYVDDGPATDLASMRVQPVTRIFSVPSFSNISDVVFASPDGDVLRFLGYELVPAEGGAGLMVMLGWQALDEMSEDYVVFVHLRDAETGELIAQVDEMPRPAGPAGLEHYPTSLWMRDEVVTDVHTVMVPSDVSGGSYTVTIGLYVPENGAHLTAGGERHVSLGTLTPRLLDQ